MNIIKKAFWGILCASAFCVGAQAQSPTKHIYLYKNGTVVFRANAEDVDSVALEENKTVIGFYKHGNNQAVYKAPYSDIDSLSYTAPQAQADLLDIKFDEMGSCWDNSPLGLLVVPTNNNGTAEVDYNKTYETWESHFYGNSWADSPKNTCFKVDYSQNDYFKEKLSDGHTLECLFKVDYDGTIADSEAKFFAAHEGGGTGFLICTKKRGKNGGNEITFLPNVTQNGKSNWIWGTSGIVPQPGRYYHIVGVWNKEEGKAYIYVDGQLMNVVAAEGELRLPPSEAAQWFGVGCDANTSNGAQCADSHIVLARVYDKALSQSEVDGLWNEVAEKAKVPVADLLDVQFTKEGGAVDISPMQNEVQVISPNNKIETYYNKYYDTYAAKINNKWSGGTDDTKTYCKVDFENNQKFRDALADGHTIETVWKATYQAPIPNSEAKWFSAMQGGGTGFLICTQNRGLNGGNELTFLPNVSQDGRSNWIWATSGVVPEAEKYYNIVGVWNKEEGKAYVYVNGVLKNTVDAKGDLRFASSGANWWGIGCDANPNGGEQGGNWEIVNARVYDNPLTEHEVANLWNKIASATKLADDSVAAHKVNPEDTVKVPAPKADLMDIEFGPNGEVKDLAMPDHNPTWIINGQAWNGEAGENAPVTYFNTEYNRYVARFDNSYGAKPNEYILGYDYENDQAFKDSIADGHTLELLVMQDNGNDVVNREIKPFSSHEGGGTGIMIETKGDWTFLPHTGAYRWATSGVQPKQKQYYHVVGVYNKEDQKAYVYVDGVLRGTADAPGNFQFARSGCMRMIIGGDPDMSDYKASHGWKGDIVFVKAYSAPLTTAQVKALYSEVEQSKADAPQFISDCSYYDNLTCKEGGNAIIAINGKGFKEGDKVALYSSKDSETATKYDVTITTDGANVTIPTQDITSGKRYHLYLTRDGKEQTLGVIKFYVTDELPQGSKVIAHRGHWNVAGASQNSRASLKNAIDLKCYGSETDVWLTTDGKLMVNHDASYNGVTIKDATSAQCKNLKLSNGENMPELTDFLAMIAAEDWKNDTTKLIIEIKDHGNDELNTLAAQACVSAVYEADVADRVEYISFSITACKALHEADTEAKVAYLSGDKTPDELSGMGLTGLDYTLDRYTSNPTWIKEARDLEMTTNVWTIDGTDDIVKSNNLGIDFITTNNPVEALKIQKIYQEMNR